MTSRSQHVEVSQVSWIDGSPDGTGCLAKSGLDPVQGISAGESVLVGIVFIHGDDLVHFPNSTIQSSWAGAVRQIAA